MKIAGTKPRSGPVSLVDYTFNPDVLQDAIYGTLKAHLADLPEYLVDHEDLGDIVRFDEATGIPSIRRTDTDELYLPQIEQIMLIFTEWSGRMMELQRKFQDASALCHARADSAYFSAFSMSGVPGNKPSIKMRELQAKQDPKYRDAEFEAQMYSSIARRLEDAASRLNKSVDALKYTHRRLLTQEGKSRVHRP